MVEVSEDNLEGELSSQARLSGGGSMCADAEGTLTSVCANASTQTSTQEFTRVS